MNKLPRQRWRYMVRIGLVLVVYALLFWVLLRRPSNPWDDLPRERVTSTKAPVFAEMHLTQPLPPV